jgi:hypothetical protein
MSKSLAVIDGTAETSNEVMYQLPNLSVDLEVDFLYSDDLSVVEQGALSVGVTTDLLALVQGMAIVRIERDGLWMQAGYANLREYRIAQAARLSMPRSTISNRRRIAEAWLTHRKLLAKVALEGRIQKLLYVSAALDKHQDRKAVLDHFRKDPVDAFKAWALPDIEPEGIQPEAEVKAGTEGISVSGKLSLLWATDYPADERRWLGGVVERAYRARSGGNMAHVVSVYDAGEARAVDLFLKRHRESK